MQKLDAKFDGVIFKVKDGSIVPPDQYIVFLVKDHAVPGMLAAYRENCVRLGADQEQIEAVDRMIQRVELWRACNPDLCKVPDAAGEKLLDTPRVKL